MIKLSIYLLFSLTSLALAKQSPLHTVETIGDLLHKNNKIQYDNKILWIGVSKYSPELGIRFYLATKDEHDTFNSLKFNERHLGALVIRLNDEQKQAIQLLKEQNKIYRTKRGAPLYVCDIPSCTLQKLTSIDVLSADKKKTIASYVISKEIKQANIEKLPYWLSIRETSEGRKEKMNDKKTEFKLLQSYYFGRANPALLNSGSAHYKINLTHSKTTLPKLIPDDCTIKANYIAKTNSIQFSSEKAIATDFAREYLLFNITINGKTVTTPLPKSNDDMQQMLTKSHHGSRKLNAELYLSSLLAFTPKSGDKITVEILLTPCMNHISQAHSRLLEYSSNDIVHRANPVTFTWP